MGNGQRWFILQGIRNYLGFQSSATIDELVSHFNANPNLTRAVISSLIADGGLRWNNRARLYQPRPAPVNRCPDCGEEEERKGHQTCQYPQD